MSERTVTERRRLLEQPLLGRVLNGRYVAGPAVDDALRVAAELVSGGVRVALERAPGPSDDAPAELAVLVRRVHAAGLAAQCEVTLEVDRLGPSAARGLAESAGEAGVGVALAGPRRVVDPLSGALSGSRVVVPAGDPDAESRCRELAGGRVRLVAGRGAAADLAFVRCLNVLMAGSGRPALAAGDPRLIAIAGERAAWNGRSPDSWEHVMPYGIRTDEQHRLTAAGHAVRVAVPFGPGAVSLGGLVAVARRLGGRS